MKPIHQALSAVGLVILGATAWQLLTMPKPPAAWLQAEAPAHFTPGETFTLRVTLTEPNANLQLSADLHGWTRRNHPLGAIGHAGSHPVGPSTHTRDFLIPVPVLPDLAAVRTVIYLSPTGNWRDQVRVVMSADIPVKTATASSPKLQPLPVHDLVPDPVIPRLESAFLRHLIVGLWLVVGCALGRQLARPQPGPAGGPKPPHKFPTLVLVTACLAIVLIEILGAEQTIGDLARQFALHHGLYEERRLPQRIAVLLTVIGMAAVMLVIIVRARRRRLVCGLLIYAAVSITATLSLHETDALLYTTFVGQPIEQIAKLMAVGLSLWGLRSRDKTTAAA
jgi:hypothetical protein